MAKMFYTIEETAEKLSLSEEEVRKLAAGDKLQQFRDRDKLMFKRDQVDALVSAPGKGGDTTESIQMSAAASAAAATDTGDLTEGGDTDKIDLTSEGTLDDSGTGDKKEDSRMATGISVFDADEIEMADPFAQTVVAPHGDDEELALESVGSGSGLLDLTRESDDTSLGAELLDEIYPGSGEGSDLALDAPSSSGAFDGSVSVALDSSSTGLENLAPSAIAPAPTAELPVYVTAGEPDDPAGNGLSIGTLLIAMAATIMTMVVAISAVIGVPVSLTESLAGDNFNMIMGGLAAGVLIFGLVGFFIGKAQSR
jgi:hypothetical protein